MAIKKIKDDNEKTRFVEDGDGFYCIHGISIDDECDECEVEEEYE